MMSFSRATCKLLSHSRLIYAKNDFIIRSVSKTSLSQARIVEVVPAFGESITEGSIASWSKNVGDQVAVDDVIAVVETDKGIVDIKSTNAGILTAKLAEDTVVVGAPLYELETTEGAVTPIKSAQTQKAATKAATTSTTPETNSHGRVPLIKFLGKRSLMKVVAVTAPIKVASPVQIAAPVTAKQSPPTSAAKVVKAGSGVDFFTLKGGAMYGRPALSQREMDAIENGGATN